MTMLNHLVSFADARIRSVIRPGGSYAVHLRERTTGRMHCVAGIPLIVYTQDPIRCQADLLRNRDPQQWEVVVRQRYVKGEYA